MAPIIRTCSLIAVGFALLATPAAARRDEPSALSYYVTARVLDSRDAGYEAAQAYALALSGAPDNERVATRAYREAVESGDKALALRAAHALDAQNKLPLDARLLLFEEALSKGDWRGAQLWLDRMEKAGGLDFLIPALSAWTALAARDGDPLAENETRPRDGLGPAYLHEQRILILLALKNVDDGVTAAKALARTDGRGLALRIAAAARLVELKERAKALELLSGDDPTIREARRMVEAGRPLPGAVNNASAGTSFLIARVASDLIRESGSTVALTLARIANFGAPGSDAAKLTLAQTLANGHRASEALDLLDGIGAPYSSPVREIRIATLQRAGRSEEALILAREAAALPDASVFDFARLGDAHGRMKQHDAAIDAYREALRRAGDDAPWNLWLLYGGALDQAGDWLKAKPALQRAVAAAPDEPAALNHLGYAMLEHGDDLVEATKLIAKASALRPDDAAITDSLGWAFYLRGEPDQSIPLLERAVAADPTEAAVGEHLGDAYWAAGRRVDARYAWRAALIQSEDTDASRRIEDKIANGLPARAK